MRSILNESKLLQVSNFKNSLIKILNFKAFIKYTILMAILVTGIGVGIFSFKQLNSQQNHFTLQMKHNEKILRELNDIESQLELLMKNPSSHVQKQELLQIENHVLELQKSMGEVAKSSDIQTISNQIASVKDAMNEQMSDIKQTVSSSMGNKEYLDATVLPFKVITIDVIGDEPYVSVNYANHVSPIGVSDVLAGWRLIFADFDTNVAEFRNDKKQYVKVSLQGE